MMHGMPFRFFWVIPLMFFGMHLIRMYFRKRRALHSSNDQSLPHQNEQTTFKKKSSPPIPEELKQAGMQVLDNLDWEIRFLERQRLEAANFPERQEIEEKLKQKRAEYHATAERLEP